MFKKSVLVLAALASVGVAQAQQDSTVTTVVTENTDKYRVETNRFGSNWFIGFGVGAGMYFGDHDKQANFGDRLGGSASVYVGKWFTPGIGIRLGVQAGRNRGLSGWDGHTNSVVGNQSNANYNRGNYGGFVKDATVSGGRIVSGDVYEVRNDHAYPLYQTQQDYVQAFGDVLFNVSQMIGGYRQDRFYSLIPYAHLGFAHSTERAPLSGQFSHELVGGIGVLNRFRLSDALDLNVDVRATYTGDHFDQETFGSKANQQGAAFKLSNTGRYGEGILSAQIGLSYNFNKRHWDRSKVVTHTVRIGDEALANLRNRIGQLEATNSDLRRQLEAALNREVNAENVAAMPLLVTFPIDRWVLSNKDKVNLEFLAATLKANPNMKYTVTGYADRGTGSVKRNIFLARKRSEVIYSYLVNECGVSESQLTKDSQGGVANMYHNDPRCSRAVLLKIAE